jgi:hypothetical protein
MGACKAYTNKTGSVIVQKIMSLFHRNHDGDRLVRDELVPGAAWVAKGEGIARRKFDGTCCLWKDGRLWKRHELKSFKSAPKGFVAAQAPDVFTGDVPGWVPVGNGPEDARHREGLAHHLSYAPLNEGTYELCGPKVNGNPENKPIHMLIEHAKAEELLDCPRTFDELREYLRNKDIEGVVWHHPDGSMAKIKLRDFGFWRPKHSQEKKAVQ